MIIFCTCLAVQADTLEQPNHAGGKIILTGRACPKPNMDLMREVYTYEANGTVTMGCWTMLDGLVHIGWASGERSVFPPDVFEPSTRSAPNKKPTARQLSVRERFVDTDES